ncbi:MAG: M48 family metalloprotease, partial [Candidatus Rokubacteria bacterium]|nr:M48 family metalloprotease [Candidatus Rokubacteria bacterium]
RRLRGPITALATLGVIGLVTVLYLRVIPAAAAAVAPHVPVSWEERVGEAVVGYLAPPRVRCTDPVRARALDAIAATLTAPVSGSPYRFRVVVANHPAVNAFSAPGGYIVVFRGLLERTRTAEELAGVLAHELQHTLRRHVVRAMVQHASTGLVLAALSGDASGLVALEAARALGTLRYSRQHELEADAEGMRMLLAAGIDPAGMIAFFESLREAAHEKGTGGEAAVLKYLSTHPSDEERIERLRALAAGAERPTARLLPAYDWADVRNLCQAAPPRRTTPAPVLHGTGRLHFVPIGAVSPGTTERLGAYYRDRFGLRIETLPSVPLEPRVIDPARRQLVAEELVTLMQAHYPELAGDPEVILMGITSDDMYIRGYRWRFAFAYRVGHQFAVVSSFGMDPVNYARPPNPELLEERLRKMVSKQIGSLYFRLPQSADRGSVMFGPILGPDDLDAIAEDF